jgi:hypothetical protein
MTGVVARLAAWAPHGLFLAQADLGNRHRVLFPPWMPAVLLGGMLFFALYLGYGCWAWSRRGSEAQPGLTREQFVRRLIGGILIEADLVLWLLYDPWARHFAVNQQLAYLSTAMLLVGVVMLLAIREAACVARQGVRMRGQLIREMARIKSDKTGSDQMGERQSGPQDPG